MSNQDWPTIILATGAAICGACMGISAIIEEWRNRGDR